MIEELIIFFYLFLGMVGGLLAIYFVGTIAHGIKLLYRRLKK